MGNGSCSRKAHQQRMDVPENGHVDVVGGYNTTIDLLASKGAEDCCHGPDSLRQLASSKNTLPFLMINTVSMGTGFLA